jgi:hypothetical protein
LTQARLGADLNLVLQHLLVHHWPLLRPDGLSRLVVKTATHPLSLVFL